MGLGRDMATNKLWPWCGAHSLLYGAVPPPLARLIRIKTALPFLLVMVGVVTSCFHARIKPVFSFSVQNNSSFERRILYILQFGQVQGTAGGVDKKPELVVPTVIWR